jgi:hypothetical protein
MIEAPHLHTPEAEARVELQHLWQLAHRMGNNDVETGAIEKIIERMKNREITPQEALAQAISIIESKNDR